MKAPGFAGGLLLFRVAHNPPLALWCDLAILLVLSAVTRLARAAALGFLLAIFKCHKDFLRGLPHFNMPNTCLLEWGSGKCFYVS